MNNITGQRLKELRIEEKLSEKKLAKILKVQETTIKSWESGENTPTPSQFVLICLHFKVCYNYLIGLTDCKQDIND